MPQGLEYLWVVEGALKTITPLMIGDGEERKDIPPGGDPGEDKVQIATVAKTLHGGHIIAAIPGTSLKGAMRAAAGAGVVERAFGNTEAAGLITFADSAATELSVEGEGESWNSEARTCVRASTAIDPRTGVADEHKLYHFEYVPAGVTFSIRLSGKSYAAEGQRLTDMLAALRPGLNSLGSGRAVLGAAIQNGWGSFLWAKVPVVRKMPASEVADWMGQPAESGERLSIFESLAKRTGEPVELPGNRLRNSRISITIRMEMEGAVLVNDLSRTGSTKQHNKPNHAALRHGSKAFVPEKSVRGALRHQAERILRTLGTEVEGDQQIRGRNDLPKLNQLGSLSQTLFGAPGWRSPFEVSEFTAETDSIFPRQEFIAIDRFTGGGIEGRKYNAEGARSAAAGLILRGRLKLDAARLERSGGGTECLGLLALTLRDVAEGDVAFGWGSARGYGAVKKLTAQLDEAPEWADLPETWRNTISREDYTVMTAESGWDEKRAVVKKWVRSLNERIVTAR